MGSPHGDALGHHDHVVIPIHDVNPVRRTPWVTYALVPVNVVVLLLTPVALGTVVSRPGLPRRQRGPY